MLNLCEKNAILCLNIPGEYAITNLFLWANVYIDPYNYCA